MMGYHQCSSFLVSIIIIIIIILMVGPMVSADGN
jgi:hypothetical protein